MISILIFVVLSLYIDSGSSVAQNEDTKRIHLVAYSDRIIEESCIAMETALLNGWTYNLLTKVDNGDATHNNPGPNSSTTFTPQFRKIFAYHRSLRFFKPDDIVLFVDAYDVIIQGSMEKFVDEVYYQKNGTVASFWDHRETILYNAEDNCHPFNVVNKK
jgi:hypothetical protein